MFVEICTLCYPPPGLLDDVTGEQKNCIL